jgi:hypothetical protein
MKLTISVVLIAMMTGAAAAQNPASILQNTKNNLTAAEQKKVQQENAALGASQSPAKPAAGSAASAPKPIVAKPVTLAPKPAPVAAQPVTAAPKPMPVAAQPAAPAPKPEVVVSVAPSAKGGKAGAAQKSPFGEPRKAVPTKIAVAPVRPQPPQGSQKVKPVSPKSVAKTEPPAPAPAKADQKNGESVAADVPKPTRLITAEGRRDPFVSPVVSRNNSPHCSTGKRCLAIDQIMVKGVVKSENGMIAVVVNSLNKAYFLKENDPVYNGYVLKITGDSVVFKETFQDRLGKEATREVVKKILTPAV